VSDPTIAPAFALWLGRTAHAAGPGLDGPVLDARQIDRRTPQNYATYLHRVAGFGQHMAVTDDGFKVGDQVGYSSLMHRRDNGVDWYFRK
jgi:hypothetical protein